MNFFDLVRSIVKPSTVTTNYAPDYNSKKFLPPVSGSDYSSGLGEVSNQSPPAVQSQYMPPQPQPQPEQNIDYGDVPVPPNNILEMLKKFFPEAIRDMARVGFFESSYIPTKLNTDSGDRGIFQISQDAHLQPGKPLWDYMNQTGSPLNNPDDIYDLLKNFKAARFLFEDAQKSGGTGYEPWASSSLGSGVDYVPGLWGPGNPPTKDELRRLQNR